MRAKLALIAAVCLGLISCIAATAVLIMQEHPPGTTMPWSPDWPEGLKELVNAEGRVRGYSECGIVDSTHAYFAGAPQDFNSFLARYAQLKDTPLALVLHAGRGMTRSISDEEQQVPFDWQITVSRLKEAGGGEGHRYVATVDLWLGGQVGLEEIEVPLNLEVRSGGELEAFIEAHEAKRQGQETPGPPNPLLRLPHYASLSEEQRGQFQPMAQALAIASEGRVELDFEGASFANPEGGPAGTLHLDRGYVTVVPVKTAEGGSGPTRVALGQDGEHLALAALSLAAEAHVYSQEVERYRNVHDLHEGVYLLAVRPEDIDRGFALFRVGEPGGKLVQACGGIWLESVLAVVPRKPLGPPHAFVVFERWGQGEQAVARFLVWSAPMELGVLRRLCLRLDVTPIIL
jgi:hypothetical protein